MTNPGLVQFETASSVSTCDIRYVEALALAGDMFSKIFLAVATNVALATSVMAQGQPAQQRAATPEEMNTYTVISAVTLCQARKLGIDFEKSLTIGATGFYSAVAQKHGMKVPEGGGKALSEQALSNGIALMTTAAAMEFCKENIPQETQDRLKAASKQMKQGGAN